MVNIYDYSKIFTIQIPIDQDGRLKITSNLVFVGDTGPTQSLLISDWNHQNYIKLLAPDCESGECGK